MSDFTTSRTVTFIECSLISKRNFELCGFLIHLRVPFFLTTVSPRAPLKYPERTVCSSLLSYNQSSNQPSSSVSAKSIRSRMNFVRIDCLMNLREIQEGNFSLQWQSLVLKGKFSA